MSDVLWHFLFYLVCFLNVGHDLLNFFTGFLSWKSIIVDCAFAVLFYFLNFKCMLF